MQIDTSMGSFTVELYHKHAPRTVKNFLELSKRGYYDGTKVRPAWQATAVAPARNAAAAAVKPAVDVHDVLWPLTTVVYLMHTTASIMAAI